MVEISTSTWILAKKLVDKQKSVVKALLTLSTTFQEDDSLNSKLLTLDCAADEIERLVNQELFGCTVDTLYLAKVLMEHEITDCEKVFENDDDTGMVDAVCQIERIKKALDEINLYSSTLEL